MLIAFEGIDMSGKTTQISLLSSKCNCSIHKFPRRSNELLQKYLYGEVELSRHASFFIFLSDIIDAVERQIDHKKLNILDRYVFSTVAYGLSYDYENAKKIVELALPKHAIPDAVVYIDVPHELSLNREREKRDKHEKSVEIQMESRERFLRMAEEKFLCENWFVFDGSKDVISLHEEIMSTLEKIVHNNNNKL